MVAGMRQEAVLAGVLFLPDLFYDHRIWAGLPASLGAGCDAVYYDEHEPMPWDEPGGRDS
jgi:hypothetical protein